MDSGLTCFLTVESFVEFYTDGKPTAIYFEIMLNSNKVQYVQYSTYAYCRYIGSSNWAWFY